MPSARLRSLALATSNGAEARQLRRYVLVQAVVLGVVSAAVAVVAGLLLTLAGLTLWQVGHADFATGLFEVTEVPEPNATRSSSPQAE